MHKRWGVWDPLNVCKLWGVHTANDFSSHLAANSGSQSVISISMLTLYVSERGLTFVSNETLIKAFHWLYFIWLLEFQIMKLSCPTKTLKLWRHMVKLDFCIHRHIWWFMLLMTFGLHAPRKLLYKIASIRENLRWQCFFKDCSLFLLSSIWMFAITQLFMDQTVVNLMGLVKIIFVK